MSTNVDYSGRSLLESFRILLLVRQCLHVASVFNALPSQRRVFVVGGSFVDYALREGGLGPCLSLHNDRCPWSLYAVLVVVYGGTAGFAGSDASRAVVAFPAVLP